MIDDRWTKRILVIASSSAVLSGIQGLPNTLGLPYLAKIIRPLWGGLSIIAAVIAAVLLVSDWARKIQSATELAWMWAGIEDQYHSLWLDIPGMYLDEVKERYKVIREREFAATTEALDLPSEKKILEWLCRRKILKSRGLM